MSQKRPLAEKHDEVLSKMESELVAQAEEVKEEPVVQEVEETAAEESAPTEIQTTEEEKQPEVEPEATETTEEELTEEEEKRLADKTKNQMSKLREKARRAEELEKEVEELKKKEQARKPLTEVETEYKKVEPTKSNSLPWEQPRLTEEDVRKTTREVLEKERRISFIGEDANYLESSVPELDPKSEDYNPKLAEDIYSTFRDRFLKDDSVRLKDIAAKKLELVREIKERASKSSEVNKKIAKQEAEQATPVSIAPPKTTATVSETIGKAKTLKELEALESKVR